MTNRIAVLMATYNGEKYLKEQLKSIINQSNKKFDLFIRDDGSNDSTLSILREFEKNYTNIHLLETKELDKKGQLANFSYLYKYVTSLNKYEYIMFSDQDDVWLPNKIAKSIDKLSHFSDKPTLIYTNYVIYDQNTEEKTKAFSRHYVERFESIFVQNWLMGCTMALNKKMIDLIKEIPLDVDNHDYWIALVASLNNNIVYLEDVTMLHRLHNNNVTTKSSQKVFQNKTKRIYDVLFSKRYRESKVNMWKKVQKELTIRFSNDHVSNLNSVLNTSPIKAVRLAKRFHYQGMNNLSTFSFYIMLFLR
ncbi:glycosyltransferase family 2 protein [Limosilactobacillus reuteri subsp. suis]|uniref:glycosyltransferase family 2 protein n=1 Tax=Limosilactobacillus reuteri TaxID=1598 RepID=UPI003995411C